MLERIPSGSREREELLPQGKVSIEEVEEARAYIDLLIKRGIKPLVSVPQAYVEEFVKYGVRVLPKQDMLTGKQFSFVAGTIGLDPYLPETEERAVFEINPARVRIEPRFTGNDRAFHGVIGFVDGIPPEAVQPLGSYSNTTWYKRKPLH